MFGRNGRWVGSNFKFRRGKGSKMMGGFFNLDFEFCLVVSFI